MVFPPPVTNTASGQSTTASVTMPASAAGNLMIAWVEVEGGNTIAITPPFNWIQVRREEYLDQLALVAYQAIATALEPPTYDWLLSASVRWTAGIAVYPATAAVTASDGRNDQYAIRLMPTLPVTTTADDSRIVAIAAQGSPPTWTPPAGWTLQSSQNTGAVIGDDIGSAFFDLNRPLAGVEPEATLTSAVGSTFVTIARTATPRDIEASNKPRQAALDLGLTETVIPQTTADMETPSNAADLVVCLSEVFSNQVNTKLNNTTTGVFCQEMAIIRANFMECADSAASQGNAGNLNVDMQIVHPAGGNLSGNQQVYNFDNGQNYDIPSSPYAANLELVGVLSGTTGGVILTIEPGSVLLDASILTSRRLFFGLPEASDEWAPVVDDIMQSGMDWCIRGPSAQALIMLTLEEVTSIPATINDIELSPFTVQTITPSQRQSAAITDVQVSAFQSESSTPAQDQASSISDTQLSQFETEAPFISQSQVATISDLSLPAFQFTPVIPVGSDQATIDDLALPGFNLTLPTATVNQAALIVDIELPSFNAGSPTLSQRQFATVNDLELPAFSILENVPAIAVPPAVATVTILDPVVSITIEVP